MENEEQRIDDTEFLGAEVPQTSSKPLIQHDEVKQDKTLSSAKSKPIEASQAPPNIEPGK